MDVMFLARIIALGLGALALLYASFVHSYHFGPGLSSPVDLHIELDHAYHERMEKEEPELKKAYDRQESASYESKDYNGSNDSGCCGDHGRDYH